MKKSISSILAFILLTSFVNDKIYFDFDILIDYSDYIVVGEVIDDDSLFYKFNISDFIKGKLSSKIVSIKKYPTWDCEPGGYYKTGQKAILFLYNINDTLRTSGGSDGEIFYNDSSHIVLNNKTEASLSQYKEAFKLFDSSVSFGLKNSKKTIGEVYFNKNYKLTNKKYYKNIDKKNPISRFLVESLKKKKKRK
jgi:hypothetical protein